MLYSNPETKKLISDELSCRVRDRRIPLNMVDAVKINMIEKRYPCFLISDCLKRISLIDETTWLENVTPMIVTIMTNSSCLIIKPIANHIKDKVGKKYGESAIIKLLPVNSTSPPWLEVTISLFVFFKKSLANKMWVNSCSRVCKNLNFLMDIK